MNKKCICVSTISRQSLANPYVDMDYRQKLIKSKAIDLNENSIYDNLGNGYSIIRPINKDKILKN